VDLGGAVESEAETSGGRVSDSGRRRARRAALGRKRRWATVAAAQRRARLKRRGSSN
jgi:hypothetical protein